MALEFQDMEVADSDVDSFWTHPIRVTNSILPVKLSYTFRQLTDADIRQVIHDIFSKNQWIDLDLSGNQITDVGIGILVQALQQNQVCRIAC